MPELYCLKNRPLVRKNFINLTPLKCSTLTNTGHILKNGRAEDLFHPFFAHRDEKRYIANDPIL